MEKQKYKSRGVYKLKCIGKLYYRVGYGPKDAIKKLARELELKPEEIEIMEDGIPQ